MHPAREANDGQGRRGVSGCISLIVETHAAVLLQPVAELWTVEVVHGGGSGRVGVGGFDGANGILDSLSTEQVGIKMTDDAVADAEENVKTERNNTRMMAE